MTLSLAVLTFLLLSYAEFVCFSFLEQVLIGLLEVVRVGFELLVAGLELQKLLLEVFVGLRLSQLEVPLPPMVPHRLQGGA